MCRLLFQVRWISGVQAAFYALCSLCGELLVHRPPAPSPVGEGWGEGFSDCLPTCGRAAAQRVGMAAIRHALPLNFCARSGVPSPTEEGGGLLRPKNTDTESSLHPVFLRTIRRARHHSAIQEIGYETFHRPIRLWGSDSFVIRNSTPKKAQNAPKHKHAA